MSRVHILMPAFWLMLYLQEDFAELGIGVFEFGGSLLRKIITLAQRSGFLEPVKGDALMPVLNKILNAYCQATRTGFEPQDFLRLETTGGIEDLALERAPVKAT